jgi:hypothetical protein
MKTYQLFFRSVLGGIHTFAAPAESAESAERLVRSACGNLLANSRLVSAAAVNPASLPWFVKRF